MLSNQTEERVNESDFDLCARQVVAVYVSNRYRNGGDDHFQLGPRSYLESQVFAMYHFWDTLSQTVRYSCIALR
jgi:hypothetical protein